jgi:hypothetical protein
MSVNEKILKKWVKAMRSGQYQMKFDGKCIITVEGDNHFFHPLGVLADIAPQEIVDFAEPINKNGWNFVPLIPNIDWGVSMSHVPDALLTWAGIDNGYCQAPYSVSQWPTDVESIDQLEKWMRKHL